MPDINIEPAINSAPAGGAFVQTLRLVDGRRALGLARWHSAGSEGVAQILELSIGPDHRRRGNGSRLIKELFKQMREYFRGRRIKLRRAWIAVEQKEQVAARAFLTEHGFHHVATVSELLEDQDLMIYSLAFD